ncbi:hypothetical protein [Actinoplanes sp. NPDC023714]|uniref:HAAS signaling domain-containing protein n=1 Tax=Actinoplanes sp. NPDC023714 TaxID=3154322 RepID=UPI0033EEA2EB
MLGGIADVAAELTIHRPRQAQPTLEGTMTAAPLAHADTLVLDYLAALWAASDDLTPEARDELMSTVTGYIALRHDLADDPARVISRLGPPEQLAETVRRGGTPTHLRLPSPVPVSLSAPAPAPAPAHQPSRRATTDSATGSDHAAVALLTAGAFVLPVIAPGAGLLMATGSASWSPAHKVAAWVLTTGSAAGALMTALILAGFSSGLALLALYLGACAGSVIAGLTLMAALRR